jgi:hypothetical protein
MSMRPCLPHFSSDVSDIWLCVCAVLLQFGAQEPGSNSDIKSFAKKNYGVTFPLMSKVDVNGSGGETISLAAAAPNTAAGWWGGRAGRMRPRYPPAAVAVTAHPTAAGPAQ